MATQFRVFRGAAEHADAIAQRANEFLTEIEGQRGEYVGSHSALVATGQGVVYVLTIVYREKNQAPQPA